MFEIFIPKKRVDTVFEIDLEELYAGGYRGIITDLDNTLVGAKAPLATPELIEWFEKVKQCGFKLVIVSNNNWDRVSAFANPLNIEFVHAAKKPSAAAFRRAMEMMGLAPRETVVVGDQLMTDVFGATAWICTRSWFCRFPCRMKGWERASTGCWSASSNGGWAKLDYGWRRKKKR